MYHHFRKNSVDLYYFSLASTPKFDVLFQKDIVFDNQFKNFEPRYLTDQDFLEFIKQYPDLQNIPEELQNFLLL